MKRTRRILVLVLLLAVNVALAVVLWRSGDPAYRLQQLFALGRFHEHDGLIAAVAEKAGVDGALLKAVVWRESTFLADKTGSSGERGLMQVDEATGRDWAAAHKIEVFVHADLYDAKTNLEAGAWRLARALEHWKDRDDPAPFALAEYHAGREWAEKWASNGATAATMLERAVQGGTRQYVDEVLLRARRYRYRGW